MGTANDTAATRTSRPRALLARAKDFWRVLVAVLIGFQGEQIGLRAGNLTFVTVTSLVPLAAVVISLVHLFNARQIDSLVKRFFTEILSPGGEQSVRAFFAAANSRAAGGLSFVVVMVSAGVLLRHLDASLNDVWAVRRKRPILVSVGLYTGVLVVGPLLIALGLVGTEGAKQFVQWLEIPYSAEAYALGSVLAAIAVFSLLYKFAPHAPVPWKSAFTGGLVAGVVWELARNLYGGIASLILNANMLYGSLGVAPLFLMWVYVGWYIILSGARLAYAVEHADFHDEFSDLLLNPRSNELIAARIAEFSTRAVLEGKPGVTTKALAGLLTMPEQRIIELVNLLVDAGLLAKTSNNELAPARDPATLTLADLSDAVGGSGRLVRRARTSRTGQFETVARLFQDADESTVEKLKAISWESLVQATPLSTRKP